MLSREEFVFTIGYNGPQAVIDKQAMRKYGKLSTKELVKKGLFRPAYASALYSKDHREQKYVMEAFLDPEKLDCDTMESAEIVLSDSERAAMDRLFGLTLIDVKRSIII